MKCYERHYKSLMLNHRQVFILGVQFGESLTRDSSTAFPPLVKNLLLCLRGHPKLRDEILSQTGKTVFPESFKTKDQNRTCSFYLLNFLWFLFLFSFSFGWCGVKWITTLN